MRTDRLAVLPGLAAAALLLTGCVTIIGSGPQLSAGVIIPLARPAWFPAMRGFIATAPRVRLLIYSEASTTDVLIRELTLTRLTSDGAAALP